MLRTTALFILRVMQSKGWRSVTRATESELEGLERWLIGRNMSFSHSYLPISPLSVAWMANVYLVNAQNLHLSIVLLKYHIKFVFVHVIFTCHSIDCIPGYFGFHCNLTCRQPNYGQNCQSECRCTEKEYCNYISGCEPSKNCFCWIVNFYS